MQEKVLKEAESKINDILEDGVNASNLEHLDKLVDIYKDIKEVECMYSGYGNYGNYGNYGRGSYGRGSYGEYGEGSYGRRGYDRKYRGHDHLDRMSNEYGRYMESRERYGASEETNKSFHYMLEALEDFIKVLHEEAESPQQKNMLMETLQSSMR